ncbi:unnamed protein product [Penicillium bialowiezense]
MKSKTTPLIRPFGPITHRQWLRDKEKARTHRKEEREAASVTTVAEAERIEARADEAERFSASFANKADEADEVAALYAAKAAEARALSALHIARASRIRALAVTARAALAAANAPPGPGSAVEGGAEGAVSGLGGPAGAAPTSAPGGAGVEVGAVALQGPPAVHGPLVVGLKRPSEEPVAGPAPKKTKE